MKTTIAIPNFNGEKLLENNLPNIIKSGADEILIVDDASKDNSLEILKKWKEKSDKLRVIIHKKNQGFTFSVNELFEEAKGDIVISLNNDVWVEKDFLKPLEKHFENKSVFAVNLHEVGEGPSIAFWKDGYFEFKRGGELEIVQKSAWASGGSAAFRKSIWKNLGGLDKILAPFYWEDVDISFRALKEGYEILWEPDAKVKHEHGTTIEKTHKKRYTNWIKERNQLLFIWNNIRDKNLKKEHKKALLKRLFSLRLGYWIPFLWALSRIGTLRSNTETKRSDLEAINYAGGKKISIITVSYNNEDCIEKFVLSVLKNLPENGELVILDNASTDETIKKLEMFKDKIKIIKSSENFGFSKGNNRAVKEASGEYLFFLNPDSELLEGTVEKLLEYSIDKNDLGIVAPQLIKDDSLIQPSVRKLPTLRGAIKEYWLGKVNSFEQYVPSEKDATQVECVYGGAILIQKEIFERINGFDERYFLYYEDLDLCKKMNERDLKVIYYPEAKVKHSIGGSVDKIDKLPWGIRTLAWFFPRKGYGSRYYQVKGSNIYHGPLKSFLITLLIYIAVKFRIYKSKEVITF